MHPQQKICNRKVKFNISPKIDSDVTIRKEGVHVFRQVLATFASSFLSLCGGFTLGFSAVLLPQLEDDLDFPNDESYYSWIASMSPLSMIIGGLCIGSILDRYGRKSGHTILIIPYVIGWLIISFSNNITSILLGRFITGLCIGAIRPTCLVYLTEISDPKYRAIILLCPSLSSNLGILISHVIGSFIHWRTAAIICGLSSITSFILLSVLKESPLWLISKGKTSEGVSAFKYFRVDSAESQIELKKTLANKNELARPFSETFHKICCVRFLKPIAMVTLLITATQFSGINTIKFYAQHIFKRTFSSEIDSFTLMMTTDTIRVVAGVVICLLGKSLPRKSSFFLCSFGTILSLFGLVTYLYVKPEGLRWVAVLFMVGYIALATAMVSLSWSFIGELFPSDVRGIGSGVSVAISSFLLFVAVKITPTLMFTCGETAMYGVFAVITLICTLLLCFVLPETNGKSLQDLEENFIKRK